MDFSIHKNVVSSRITSDGVNRSQFQVYCKYIYASRTTQRDPNGIVWASIDFLLDIIISLYIILLNVQYIV